MAVVEIVNEIKLNSSLIDYNGNPGTCGQILSSVGDGVDWITLEDLQGVTSITTSNGISGGPITATGALEVDSTVIRTTGNQSMSGTKTFSTQVIAADFEMTSVQSRTKLSVWSGSTYGMGMETGYTYGGLASDYAMTFQMNDSSSRGFWWGDSAHTNAQGAMALTTNGLLTVASGMRLGYGETDTTTPGGTYTLSVSGAGNFTSTITATGGNSTEWNTAYDNRITSLTTTGTSGVATLISNVLNIPNYADGQGVTSVSAGNGMNFTTITGTGPVTMGTPGTLTSATTNGVSATSHTHNITTGIANNNIVKINSTTVATGEYARFTTTGLESLTAGELAADIGAGTVTSVGGTGTVSGLTLTGTVTSSGNLTLGGTLALTSGNITTGLGFTPYNATNPAGYTANTGTVTSVAATPGSGISISGSPITTSGTLTITNTDPGSQQAIFKNFAISGQQTIQADTNADTLTFVNGAGIAMTTTASTDTLTVTNTDGGSSQNIFKNIAVSGQSTVVADTNNDTLTLVAGTGLAITTNALSDTITFSSDSPKGIVMVTSHMDQTANNSSLWYYMPFVGDVDSTASSLASGFVTPFAGYIKSITYSGAGNGTGTSATTIAYRILRNGAVVYGPTSAFSIGGGTSSGKSLQTSLSSSNATFVAAQRISIQIQVNVALSRAMFSIILQET